MDLWFRRIAKLTAWALYVNTSISTQLETPDSLEEILGGFRISHIGQSYATIAFRTLKPSLVGRPKPSAVTYHLSYTHPRGGRENTAAAKMASKVLTSALRHITLKPGHLQAFSTAAAAAVESCQEDAGGITMKGVKISGRPLYLDMQATSPVDPRVLDAMLPYYLSRYGNPHSRTHLYGWESDQAVESARAQVAALIKASPKEIIFTSGATESNNISVKGVLHFYRDKKKHVITTQTEHKRRPRIRVEPQMNGGGQERGIRSGTVPTPLVVGFGAACELGMKEMEYDDQRIKGLQERLLNGIRQKLDGVVVNGNVERRYGIGRFTTEEEIDRAVELTVKQVEKLREMSPLYEMVKEGIDIKSIQWAQH
ncbi:hypothetical protein M9H77_04368 [Catharanthus roseus]|uniref:Uncharacterized protein n=1 Tax=Catharanthus roseus TaxID=4058 RepID=A0ACC0CE20_CATRO|nr:hypothetical protein M9H77_04368 [Catharanthus roseus]